MKEDLQPFLTYYINKYAQKSITYLELKATMTEYLVNKYGNVKANTILSLINWDAWIQQSGPAPVTIDFTTDSSRAMAKLANDYIAFKGLKSPTDFMQFNETDNINLKVIFLRGLVTQMPILTTNMLELMDSDLGLTYALNPEIGQRWFPLSIAMAFEPAFSYAENYVSRIGRQKYILPVYTALVQNGYRNLAYQWFNKY